MVLDRDPCWAALTRWSPSGTKWAPLKYEIKGCSRLHKDPERTVKMQTQCSTTEFSSQLFANVLLFETPKNDPPDNQGGGTAPTPPAPPPPDPDPDPDPGSGS